MKEIIALIEERKQKFSQLAFFEFLQDKSITPRQKLAFAPYFAPFVMGFAELNQYVWRDEESNDPIQAIVNQHTYEDDSHWIWFLEDIQKLGFNVPMNFNDSLRFIWSEETKLSRQTIYEIYSYSHRANPLHKLVIIESIEAIASLFFAATTPVVQELRFSLNKELKYFGMNHLKVESNHSKDSLENQEYLDNIQILEDDYSAILNLIDQVFRLFTDFLNQLVILAKRHKIEKELQYLNVS